MSTAATPEAENVGARPRRFLRASVDALTAALIALAVYVAFGGHAFLNYDSFYSLVWGADLAAGHVPRYDAPVAPTPHPLAIALGAALAPLGDGAEGAFLALVLLGLGALVVGLYRLGAELFAWPVGLLAAAIVLTRQPILNFGIRGYVDLPTVALIVWAAVLEARRPRRGAPVLVLLAIAGLLRPEAWLFAGAYWLWLAPPLGWGARARMAALAATAPLLWALSDLLVTGNPLWSLQGTSALAAELERPTGLLALPGVLPFRLGEILRLPELIAAVLGFAAGLVWLRRRTLLPLALAALNGVAYTAFAIAGLPLLGRYLFLAASMLALVAALAVFGWTALAPDNGPGTGVRRAWTVAGGLILVAILAFSPNQVDRLLTLRADIAARDRVQDDLHSLVTRAGAPALARCRPTYLSNHRNVPNLRLWASLPFNAVLSGLDRPGPNGLFVAPASARVEALSVLDPNDPRRRAAPVPRDYEPFARNDSWILYGGCRA